MQVPLSCWVNRALLPNKKLPHIVLVNLCMTPPMGTHAVRHCAGHTGHVSPVLQLRLEVQWQTPTPGTRGHSAPKSLRNLPGSVSRAVFKQQLCAVLLKMLDGERGLPPCDVSGFTVDILTVLKTSRSPSLGTSLWSSLDSLQPPEHLRRGPQHSLVPFWGSSLQTQPLCHAKQLNCPHSGFWATLITSNPIIFSAKQRHSFHADSLPPEAPMREEV